MKTRSTDILSNLSPPIIYRVAPEATAIGWSAFSPLANRLHRTPTLPLLQTSIANHPRISGHRKNTHLQPQKSYFIVLIQGS